MRPHRISSGFKTHGESRTHKTAEYRIWTGMLTRCHNHNAKDYPRYGGRGIVVCDRWRNSYEAFLSDMGRRPSAKHSIDRKKSGGNYEPGNCRWATTAEQSRNRKDNRYIRYRGKRMLIKDACSLIGTPYSTAMWRALRGWTDRQILGLSPHY